MTTSLFQFELTPVAEIQPWMGPEGPHLHWYGLTHGLYWMQVGDHRLFEYSLDVVSRFAGPRFCDYQVARLHDDVLELVPHALEPVPQELQPYIAGEWDRYWKTWSQVLGDGGPNPDARDAAIWWMNRRTLDSAYLTPSANIMVWSTPATIRIQWDNRLKEFQGSKAWSADYGFWEISRGEFVNEVRSFHDRLIEQMDDRVSQVAAGALGAHIHIDSEGLIRQQAQEARSIFRRLAEPEEPTDWHLVIDAVKSIEGGEA
jgi:Family of unknown function (DUF5984)